MFEIGYVHSNFLSNRCTLKLTILKGFAYGLRNGPKIMIPASLTRNLIAHPLGELTPLRDLTPQLT